MGVDHCRICGCGFNPKVFPEYLGNPSSNWKNQLGVGILTKNILWICFVCCGTTELSSLLNQGFCRSCRNNGHRLYGTEVQPISDRRAKLGAYVSLDGSYSGVFCRRCWKDPRGSAVPPPLSLPYLGCTVCRKPDQMAFMSVLEDIRRDTGTKARRLSLLLQTWQEEPPHPMWSVSAVAAPPNPDLRFPPVGVRLIYYAHKADINLE